MTQHQSTQYDLNNLKSLYTSYSLTPIPDQVFIPNNDINLNKSSLPSQIQINWQYRDVVQLKTVTFQKSYLFSGERRKYISVGLPEELSGDIMLQACSGDGQRRVILKSKKADSKK